MVSQKPLLDEEGVFDLLLRLFISQNLEHFRAAGAADTSHCAARGSALAGHRNLFRILHGPLFFTLDAVAHGYFLLLLWFAVCHKFFYK